MTAQYGIDATAADLAVRAQEDFFRHINGTWLKETEIPADKSIYGAFSILADGAEAAVQAILEEAAANPTPGVSQQIGDLYASFLNEERANEFGAAPIAAELKLIATIRGIDDVTAGRQRRAIEPHRLLFEPAHERTRRALRLRANPRQPSRSRFEGKPLLRGSLRARAPPGGTLPRCGKGAGADGTRPRPQRLQDQPPSHWRAPGHP